MVHSLSITRFSTFVVVSVFGTIASALGLCACFLSFSYDGYPNVAFPALTVATGGLTLLTLPVMMLIDYIRQGAVTSYIAFEVGWLGFLGALFLATGLGLTSTYGGWKVDPVFNNSVQAFTYLPWILCWYYAIRLYVAANTLANRGCSGVWKQAVQHTDFSAPAQDTGTPAQDTGTPAQDTGTPQVAGVIPKIQSQAMQPAQQVYPAVTPQLVSQLSSYPVSRPFGYPNQIDTRRQPVPEV